jgi:hypothetical protein
MSIDYALGVVTGAIIATWCRGYEEAGTGVGSMFAHIQKKRSVYDRQNFYCDY